MLNSCPKKLRAECERLREAQPAIQQKELQGPEDKCVSVAGLGLRILGVCVCVCVQVYEKALWGSLTLLSSPSLSLLPTWHPPLLLIAAINLFMQRAE